MSSSWRAFPRCSGASRSSVRSWAKAPGSSRVLLSLEPWDHMKETASLAHPPLRLARHCRRPTLHAFPSQASWRWACPAQRTASKTTCLWGGAGGASLGGAGGPFFSSRRGEGWSGAPSSHHQRSLRGALHGGLCCPDAVVPLIPFSPWRPHVATTQTAHQGSHPCDPPSHCRNDQAGPAGRSLACPSSSRGRKGCTAFLSEPW